MPVRTVAYKLIVLVSMVMILPACAPLVGELGHVEDVAKPEPSPQLKQRVENVLQHANDERILSTEVNAAWQIMHAVICYGMELQIETPDRGRVSALEYVFSNGQMRGMQLMITQENLQSTGRPGVKARFNPGSYIGQGHVDQWLAICAMADIPITTKIQVGDRVATIEDWARQAQFDVSNNPVDEFSWTLIALTHYFPTETRWDADGGIRIGWEELLAEELRYGLEDAACGGTHRMAGIIRALRAAEANGIDSTPTWSEARELVASLMASTKEQRGADGRLSSFYFDRSGGTRDLYAELSSTGHMFEFVALAATEEELSSPWIELSAQRLCELIENLETQSVECGALYHALSGLKIYLERRWP
ncbi:MAG: hypothetical protein AAF483_06570 [Planctomycetota bacterium]